MGDTTGPRPGDGVWHHEYKNGVIQRIDWEERDVYVLFYYRYGIRFDLGKPHTEVFDLSLFEVYEDWAKQWMIYGL